MNLPLFKTHEGMGAKFMKWSEVEVPDHYGDPLGEHRATRTQSGLIDQSPRGKLSLKGTDRVEFLNGMVTNDVKNLEPGQGCYAAFTTLKAKILSDCRIYSLPDSLLLDLEVGIINKIQEHLDRYIIASDVTMEDLTNKWGLLSIYGPESSSVLSKLLGTADLPEGDCSSRETKYKSMDLLCVRNHITGEIGYDLYIPAEGILTIFQEVKAAGVSLVGWRALETLRIEAGIPRYGLDMDESHFPMEAGLTQRAISETKGCYIGQETIARAMAQGQMNRFLVGLEVEGEVPPKNNEALMKNDRSIGKITSGIRSPSLDKTIALGYIHRDFSKAGSEVSVILNQCPIKSRVVDLPFYNRPS